MGRIKAEAVRIVEGHGGIVNQFVGDEVLALFGIPSSHEDDPVRAVRAARDLHEMVRAMSTTAARAALPSEPTMAVATRLSTFWETMPPMIGSARPTIRLTRAGSMPTMIYRYVGAVK